MAIKSGQHKGGKTGAIKNGSSKGLMKALALLPLFVFLLFTACLGIFFGGCTKPQQFSAPPAGAQRKVRVVATIYPLAEFARQVGGGRVEVTQLLPSGAEPHHWEPSPKDMVKLHQAQIVIFNGAGLEPWAGRVLPSLRARGIRVVDAAQGLDLLTFAEEKRLGLTIDPGSPGAGGPKGPEERKDLAGTEAPEGEHHHRHQEDETAQKKTGSGGFGADPHVWLDPLLAGEIASRLAEEFTAVDPAGAADYEKGARALQNQLDRLHQEYAAAVRKFRSRDFVVSHAAFGYLARRYGLRQVAVLGLSPEQEPDAATLSRVVDFCREREIKYIFFESLVSPRVAEMIAREVGAQTLPLTPVGGLTPEEKARGLDYFALMRQNLANLERALGE